MEATRKKATTAGLRIFSYLPNPRIWKATIAARLNSVDIEVRGAAPKELQTWLWDFDARPLTPEDASEAAEAQTGRTGFKGVQLHKTRAFLDAHPYGTVPAAFSPDGSVGIFESNSIMRTVARLGEARFPLYGTGAYEASRVDSFLDASLVFARDAQTYLLALLDGSISADIHARARDVSRRHRSRAALAAPLSRRRGTHARGYLFRLRARAVLERARADAGAPTKRSDCDPR